jgi:Ca-activated chloride channel homolog
MTDQALAVRADRRLIRAVHHSTRYVLAEVTAPPASATAARPRVNVAFVLDRSGSMGARDKFTLAAEAVRQGVGRLAATDRFSVVVYDEQVDVVAPGRPASATARADALRALGRVEPRGTTDLGGGWLRGAEQVAAELDPEAVNRVLLLTDGLANVGITSPAALAHHAAELRARGVNTSTFGVGLDFDEGLLGGMADAGGGTFRFISTPEDIPALIGNEVGELLEVTSRGVELRVAGPDGLRVECLSPFPVEATGRTSTVHLGDLVADQVVRLVLAVGFPLGEVGREIGAELSLADRDGRLAASATLTWAFARGRDNDGQARDREVDRVVARAYADRALRAAVELNRRGAWDEARSALRAVARRIRSYAGSDPVLREIVAELERESEAWAVERPEMDRKVAFAASTLALRSRSVDGAVYRRQR